MLVLRRLLVLRRSLPFQGVGTSGGELYVGHCVRGSLKGVLDLEGAEVYGSKEGEVSGVVEETRRRFDDAL